MSSVIVDTSVRDQLPDLTKEIEFRDESGKTLGWFLPTDLYKQLILCCAAMVETKVELPPQQPSGPGREAFHNDDECLEIILDGPEDTTVRPMRPRAVIHELERRQRHARLMEQWKQQQEQEKAKESSDTSNGRDSVQGA